MSAQLHTKVVDTQALKDLQERVDQLPLLPQVLVKLMQLSPDSETYFEEFEQLVEQDPPFAVRVIALANSAASSPVAPKLTIRDAIVRMGVGTISSLVSSLAVQQVFVPTKPHQVRLWQHSVGVAVAAQHLAKLLPALEVEPGQAYLAGLLHDIGRFVMLEHAAPNLQKVDESNWGTPDELIQADLEIYKFTHSELGYLACNRWAVPGKIAEVVRSHHQPLETAALSSAAGALCCVIQIADHLAIGALQQPETAENLQDAVSRTLQKVLPADADIVPETALVAMLPAIRAETERLLNGLGFALN